MIPREDVTEGWYIVRDKYTSNPKWECCQCIVSDDGGVEVLGDCGCASAEYFDFHSRIEMPDERNDDGE